MSALACAKRAKAQQFFGFWKWLHPSQRAMFPARDEKIPAAAHQRSGQNSRITRM